MVCGVVLLDLANSVTTEQIVSSIDRADIMSAQSLSLWASVYMKVIQACYIAIHSKL